MLPAIAAALARLGPILARAGAAAGRVAVKAGSTAAKGAAAAGRGVATGAQAAGRATAGAAEGAAKGAATAGEAAGGAAEGITGGLKSVPGLGGISTAADTVAGETSMLVGGEGAAAGEVATGEAATTEATGAPVEGEAAVEEPAQGGEVAADEGAVDQQQLQRAEAESPEEVQQSQGQQPQEHQGEAEEQPQQEEQRQEQQQEENNRDDHREDEQDQVQERRCEQCGDPLPDNAEVCPNCGAPTGSGASAPGALAPMPQNEAGGVESAQPGGQGDSATSGDTASPLAQPMLPGAPKSEDGSPETGAGADGKNPSLLQRGLQGAKKLTQKGKNASDTAGSQGAPGGDPTQTQSTQLAQQATNLAVDKTADAFAAETGGASKVAGELAKAKLGNAMKTEEKAQREGKSQDMASVIARNVAEGTKQGIKSGITMGAGDKKEATAAVKALGSKLGMKGVGEKAGPAQTKANLDMMKSIMSNPTKLTEMAKQVGTKVVAALVQTVTKEAVASVVRSVMPYVLAVLAALFVVVFLISFITTVFKLGGGSKGSSRASEQATYREPPMLRAGLVASDASKLMGLTAPLLVTLNACGDVAPIAVTFGAGGTPGTAHYDGRAVRISTRSLPREKVAALEACLQEQADPCVERLLGPDPDICVSAADSCDTERQAHVDRTGGDIALTLRAACTPASQAASPPSAP